MHDSENVKDVKELMGWGELLGVKNKCTKKEEIVVQTKVMLPCACKGGVCEMNLYFHSFLTSLLDREGGKRRRGWLRRSAINREVAGSISDRVIGIFHLHNSFGPIWPWFDSSSNMN